MTRAPTSIPRPIRSRNTWQESGRKKERGRRGMVRHCRANEKKQVQKFNGDVGMKIKLLLVASTLLLAVAVYGILAR